METLDWTKLAGHVAPDTSKVPYEPNKHLFRKVAFDVFQLNSSPVESLWVLQQGDDGEEYLVAQYQDEEVEGLEAKSHWTALADREGKNVTLAYKEMPIQRFASTDYGFTAEDVHLFQQTLVSKLANEPEFVKKLLGSQPDTRREMLLQRFPELA